MMDKASWCYGPSGEERQGSNQAVPTCRHCLEIREGESTERVCGLHRSRTSSYLVLDFFDIHGAVAFLGDTHLHLLCDYELQGVSIFLTQRLVHQAGKQWAK